MTQLPEIEDLGSIIESRLNGKLISYKSRYLTKPGDNYGSTMLGITTNIQKSNGNIEQLELVAKLPPTNPDFWEIFQPERTFITECKCYTVLAPELKKLQQESGIKENEIIDVFPECYGARINLNDTDDNVDKNATLVLENLSASGYKVVDRFKGFDYEHALIIIRDLAYFHALPIALRTFKPQMFENQIKPFIMKFDIGANVKPELQEKLEETNKNALKKAKISEDDLKQLEKLFGIMDERNKNIKQCSDGLYTTVAHCDLWVNNMMILYDDNGKPDRTKILDFQIAQYESLVIDIIFFLFTSVQSKVLEEKCEELLKHYYKCFIWCLEKVGCDISAYSYQSFIDEINRFAYLEIPHIIMMLRVLLLKRDAIKDLDELDPNKFSDDSGVGEEYYQKVYDVVDLLKKFNWFEVKE